MEVIVHDHNEYDHQFKCSFCKSVSFYSQKQLNNQLPRETFQSLLCNACGKESIWRNIGLDGSKASFERIFPVTSSAPLPADDMPPDVKKDYEEAALVSMYSSKAACALLRLGLQKLCKHLGEPGEHLDTDIRSLAKKDGFPASIVTAADTLRITGNKAVHPGEMSEDDIEEVSKGLFGLLNYIVEQGITKPQELQELYEKIPEGPRKRAEARDNEGIDR